MDITAIAIVSILFVGAPAVILHFVAKIQAAKKFSAEDENSLGDMRVRAEKLENRIQTLEHILDDEVPGWRRRDYD